LREIRDDKKFCKKYGIPSWLRRYAKRYGVDVETILQTHRKYR